MKTKLIISTICVALITLLGVAYAFGGNTPQYDIGNKIKENKNNPERSKIVAKINGHEITKQYFDNIKTSFETNKPGQAITDDQVLNEIVSKTVLLDEAEKQGLNSSREDTLKRMEEVKKGIESNENAMQEFNNFLDGVGMTAQEYWTSEDTILTYQRAFSIANLKNNILKDIGREQKNKYWDDYSQKLKSNVKIEKEN